MPNPSIGLLFLRVATGAFMLTLHGWGKLTNFNTLSGQFPDPIGLGSEVALILAISAEFFCALLLIFGIGTRLVAIPLIITMLVAAFIIHADDPFAKKEFALLYAIPFITLLLSGGGAMALGRSIPALRRWS